MLFAYVLAYVLTLAYDEILFQTIECFRVTYKIQYRLPKILPECVCKRSRIDLKISIFPVPLYLILLENR